MTEVERLNTLIDTSSPHHTPGTRDLFTNASGFVVNQLQVINVHPQIIVHNIHYGEGGKCPSIFSASQISGPDNAPCSCSRNRSNTHTQHSCLDVPPGQAGGYLRELAPPQWKELKAMNV